MQAMIPVVCETQGCGTIWLADSVLHMRPGKIIYSVWHRAGACPSCEGVGVIPDGKYTCFSADLFHEAEISLTLTALGNLWKKAAEGATREEIKSDSDFYYPFLSALTTHLPKGTEDLNTFLVKYICIFQHMQNREPDAPVSHIHVETNVFRVISQISDEFDSIWETY